MTATLHPITRARAHDLLGRMRAARVTIVGDVMLDRYLIGDSGRISPEAPVPVVTVDEERVVPGGAANVAANVAALGAHVDLIGTIGDDGSGAALCEALQSLGISSAGLITVPGRPTITKTRIVARNQQVVRIDREVTNPLPDQVRDATRAAAHASILRAQVLLIEDYDKGTLDATMAGDLVAAGRARKIPVVVDPKMRNFFAYSGATVFKPNHRELETAFSTHFTGDDADLEGARLRLGTDHLLLTLGADGLALISAGMPLRRTASLAQDVFDVSGAGDTVVAWVASALAVGADIAEAAWLANVAAGIEVGKRGTASVSPGELLDRLAEDERKE
jgi:D-beta-D-heptose 7-phosphate kinase/D-beta-D-heptose 1-phosphate adenosyltransferase